MTKHNKTEKQLWPYIVISFAIVFAMAVVIQRWTNTKTETVYSNDTIENIVEKYQEVDDADLKGSTSIFLNPVIIGVQIRQKEKINST